MGREVRDKDQGMNTDASTVRLASGPRTVLVRPSVGAAGHIVQRSDLTTHRVVVDQVVSALPEGAAKRVLVAYEPVWAIGAAQPAPHDYISSVCHAVRLALGDRLGDFGIVYGGSAGPGLVAALGDSVDGLFLGRFAHDPAAVEAVLDELAAAR